MRKFSPTSRNISECNGLNMVFSANDTRRQTWYPWTGGSFTREHVHFHGTCSPRCFSFSRSSSDSPNDIWAVGGAGNCTLARQPLVLHWDGQSWQPVKAPSFQSGSQLSGISALGADDICAVGSIDTKPIAGDSLTLVEHWNGQSWQAVPSLNPGTPAPLMGQA